MDNDMDSMLETYLFETNSLMDQLDEILLEAEKSKRFTVDNVNEIFRIMHTIKGSSAMMEFDSLMTAAHRLEDLFFVIRDKGVEAFDEKCDEQLHHEIFNLLFEIIDFMRSEIEKIENSEPLTENIDKYKENINSYLNKIKAALGDGDAVEETPAAKAPAPAVPEPAAFVSPDDSPYYLKLKFEASAWKTCGHLWLPTPSRRKGLLSNISLRILKPIRIRRRLSHMRASCLPSRKKRTRAKPYC